MAFALVNVSINSMASALGWTLENRAYYIVLISTSSLVGALLGALSILPRASNLRRMNLIIYSNCILSIGCVVSVIYENEYVIAIGRLLYGFGA
jgi:MFS family permease